MPDPMTHSAENDAHDGQHPHPCGPCSFVRARRADNAEKGLWPRCRECRSRWPLHEPWCSWVSANA